MVDLNLVFDENPIYNTLTNPVELFLQEIELAIKTQPNQIYGKGKYLNLNRYLFNRYVTTSQIQNEISNYIATNCEHSSYFKYNIEVNMIKDSSGKDVIYIKVIVTVDTIDGKTEDFIEKFLIS